MSYEDDFITKTTEMLNGFKESIEKGMRDLTEEVKAQSNRSPVSGFTNPFEKILNRATGNTASKYAEPKNEKKVSIPANRMDTKDGIKIVCELPGCEKKNLKLDYDKDSLVVRAKKEAAPLPGDITFHEDDCKYGIFERRFRVGKVDPSTIHASYKDGLLIITCVRPAEDFGSGITID